MNGEKLFDWIINILMIEIFVCCNIALIILFLKVLGVI